MASATLVVAGVAQITFQATCNTLLQLTAPDALRGRLPEGLPDLPLRKGELEVERAIVTNILALATLPARSQIALVRFRQAQLAAALETLRLAVETRRAYYRAVGAQELVAYARKNPGKIRVAVSGYRTAPDLVIQELNKVANIRLATVPFTGGGGEALRPPGRAD